MGVALMTSTSTDSAPRRWSAARWSTPKRCCSSTMASPRRAKATPSWMSACVPTASGMVPSASPASALFRAFPLTAPVSSTGSMPSGAASGRTVSKCCSASSSVGAISTAWWPASMTVSAARSATSVLPLPTSPWRSRRIGCGAARSAAISAKARSCAPVGRKGRRRCSAGTRRVDGGKAVPGSAPSERQPELEEEELVEDERAVGERARLAERLEVRLGSRRVHVAERAGEVDHALARRDRGRERARHALGELLDRRLRDAPHRPGVHRGRLLVDGHDARQRGRVLVGAEDLHLGVDDALGTAAERRLDPAVHDEALPLAQAAAEVRDLVEPDEEEEPVAVAQHDLEDVPAAAARARFADAGDLAHHRRLLADVELAERLERAPVLVAERQVIEEVLDGREAEARQLGGALRADAAHRLRGLGERGERRADGGRRRPVLAPRRWRRRRFAQRRQERVRAAQQPLLVARRALAERGQDALQLGERPRGARRPARPRARHALGERREREARLVEAPEVVRRQVLERRRERPEQLGERRRGRRHARRWCSCSGRTVNGPRRMRSMPSAAAAAAASVVKYGTRHSSAVRRMWKASRCESAPAGVLTTSATSPRRSASTMCGPPSETLFTTSTTRPAARRCAPVPRVASSENPARERRRATGTTPS